MRGRKKAMGKKRKGPQKDPNAGRKPSRKPAKVSKTPVNQRTAKQKANAKKFGNTAFGKKILGKKKK